MGWVGWLLIGLCAWIALAVVLGVVVARWLGREWRPWE